MGATMLIRFKKRQDGIHSMTCVRPDGTVTGQRSGAFFVAHDLGHYAIETTLGLEMAFFGLTLIGWNIGDFGTPWPKGRFPAEGIGDLTLAENLAGLLDSEWAGQFVMSVAEVNAHLAVQFARLPQEGYPDVPTPVLTDSELATIRQVQADLLARWKAVPVGGEMELQMEF